MAIPSPLEMVWSCHWNSDCNVTFNCERRKWIVKEGKWEFSSNLEPHLALNLGSYTRHISVQSLVYIWKVIVCWPRWGNMGWNVRCCFPLKRGRVCPWVAESSSAHVLGCWPCPKMADHRHIIFWSVNGTCLLWKHLKRINMEPEMVFPAVTFLTEG